MSLSLSNTCTYTQTYMHIHNFFSSFYTMGAHTMLKAILYRMYITGVTCNSMMYHEHPTLWRRGISFCG